MKKKISQKDKKDWLNFINSKKKIFDKDKEKPIEKLKEKIIDLHGHSLDNANIIIDDFIQNCFKQKVNKIIIITGKGTRSKNVDDPYKSKDLSILKYSVPNYIESKKYLMNKIKEINYNQINDIYFGSFEIILKKIKE